ncbi:MAG: DNA primase [Pseudomonadota bacterium]
MAGRIPQQFIDELVGRADIVELIGSRVPLKKAGREYRACCPFHDEKTPSFWVSPVKQFYHCFGCGAHGTALGFLMNYDHLPFPEAVEELASRLGVEVPREMLASAPRAAGEDLYSALAEVTAFYRQELAGNERALAYVRHRGLESGSLERFALGYAANSWNDVLRRFGSTDDGRRRLSEAGLIIERDRGVEGSRAGDGYYDRFRDRLMFPIRDARGRVLAFGGRILDQGEPKYLNSPETSLFHKGRELYGLYEVRQNRGPLRRLLIVEGYMDVVRLHQAGIPYAVATLGTATTPEHLKRAFRVVSEVIFCFDGDRAGRAAAWRALNNALPEAQAGREMRFLFLPDGEDPDSLVGREGATAFEARYADALPLSEYLVSHLLEEIDVRHADGKARFVATARPLLERVPEGTYRELLQDRLAAAISVTAERFLQIVGPAAITLPSQAQPEQPRHEPQRGRTRRSTGRGGLVRQAVQNLLHFPTIAARVSEPQRALLATLDEPGIDVLAQLLDDLTLNPATSTAQVLERWRDHAAGERLARLASAEMITPDAKAAAGELLTAVQKLLEQGAGARLDELIEKSRGADLNDEEKTELKALMLVRSRQG